MKLFNFINYKAELNDSALLLPEIKAMLTLNYNKQKGDAQGRKKDRALAEFTYVYLAYDYGSPYADFSKEQRLKQALIDAGLPQDYAISDELKALIDKYKTIQEEGILALRLLKKVKASAEKLTAYFDNVDFTEQDEYGKFVYSVKEYMDALKRLPDLIEGLDKLEKQVKKQLSSEDRLYGDSLKGFDEDVS
jgi:GH15 family glucan-1,4-alpha-glucosidase